MKKEEFLFGKIIVFFIGKTATLLFFLFYLFSCSL